MQGIITALKDTPIPTILVVGGIAFLLLAVAGQVAGKIEVPPARQKWAGLAGTLLLMAGVTLHLIPTLPPGSRAPSGASAAAPSAPDAEHGSTADSRSTGIAAPTVATIRLTPTRGASRPASTSTPPPASIVDSGIPKPVSQAMAIVTPQQGAVSRVQADSLVACLSSGINCVKGLPVLGGATIEFSKIKNFETVNVANSPGVTLNITLLDGTSLQDGLAEDYATGTLRGTTNLGVFEKRLSQVKHVEFQR